MPDRFSYGQADYIYQLNQMDAAATTLATASAASAASAATASAAAATASAAASAAAAAASAIAVGTISGRPSIRPALNLDFANSKLVDPRITLTCLSTRSYFDALAVLKTAAIGDSRIVFDPITNLCQGLLIEDAATNLVNVSEEFGHTSWAPGAATNVTPNATTAPDGSNSADLVAHNSSSGNVSQNVTIVAASTVTFSVYAKKGNTNHVRFELGNTANIWFNLLTGATGQNNAGSGNYLYSSKSIQSVGNGWYRCIATITTTVVTSVLFAMYATASDGSGSSALASAYFFGAQAEVGTMATSYVPKYGSFTSRATIGTFMGSNGLLQTAAINAARTQYSPMSLSAPSKLLLEAAATNLFLSSVDQTNVYWTRTGCTVSTTAVLGPDGTATMQKIVEGVVVSSTHSLQQPVGTTNTTAYTFSCYIKASERYVGIEICDRTGTLRYAYFDPATGLFSGVSTGLVTSVETLPSGIWRIRVTTPLSTGATTAYAHVYTANALSLAGLTYTGDGTSGFYIWGLMFETGLYATSYIQTTTTTVTRSADVFSNVTVTRALENATISGTNFTGWYNATGQSIHSEFIANATGTRTIWSINDGTVSNRIYLQTISGALTLKVVTAGVLVVTLTLGTLTNGTAYRVATAWAASDYAASVNGATAVTASSGTLPVVTTMTIGSDYANTNIGNLTISKISGYGKRLVNAELLALAA